MTTDRLPRTVVVSGAEHWEAEFVERLEERLIALADRSGPPLHPIRIVLEQHDHEDPDERYEGSVHMEMRNRTLHANASGPDELHVSMQLEERLRSMLEHERERRLWSRHRRPSQR